MKSDFGFEQCGALLGQVAVDNNLEEEIESKETFELNLPGLRRVILGHDEMDDSESIRFIGIGVDGSVLSYSKKFSPEGEE